MESLGDMTGFITSHHPERRKAPRHRVTLFSSVSLIKPPYDINSLDAGLVVSALTENISVDGLSLMVSRSHYITQAQLSELDRLLHIVLSLPLGDSGIVELIARIRQPARFTRASLKMGYHVGVQIHEMSAPNRALYNEYLSTIP